MSNVTFEENDLVKPRILYVDNKAIEFGLERIDEKYSIHYRYVDY
jgi:hypothetical protein